MKCSLCNFLRYCLLIYTTIVVATGGTIITKTNTSIITTKTTTNITKTTTTTSMTIETSPRASNNCQANVECCYNQQQQQYKHLSGKKDIKLTKREIDERLQQPFTVMQSIEEEMEPEEHIETIQKQDHVDKDDNNEDDDDDDDDDEDLDEDYENSLEKENDENASIDNDDDNDDNDNDDDDDDDEDIKANKKKQRQRKRRRRKGQNVDKRKRKRKKQQQQPLGQPANLLLASLTQLPTASPIQQDMHKYKPHKILMKRKKRKDKRKRRKNKPKLKPLKYMLHKGNLIKKKKQEYLSHLGFVFLPFVKFIAFFTVLNPFTLAVFFFMLISPIVFALLGFTVISLILRPIMNLLFAVKHRVSNIKHNNNRKYRTKEQRKHQHLAQQRPITIHKHFYPTPRPSRPKLIHAPLYLRKPQQRPLLYHPHRADIDIGSISFHNSTAANGLVNLEQAQSKFNPVLPQIRQQVNQIHQPNLLSTRFILPSL